MGLIECSMTLLEAEALGYGSPKTMGSVNDRIRFVIAL